MMRIVTWASSTIAILAATVLTVELWVRAHPNQFAAPVGPDEIQLPPDLVQRDDLLGKHFKPNGEKTFASPHGDFTVNYNINEIGLRDSGMISGSGRPPRLILLGDAFAEGYGIMREATFMMELQRQLRAMDDVHPDLRLLNLGMTGFGAAQSYLLSRRVMERFEADIILFVYSSLMPVADHRFLANAALDSNSIVLRAGPPKDAVFATEIADDHWLNRLAIFDLLATRRRAVDARQALIAGDPDKDLFAATRASQEQLMSLHKRSLAHVAALHDIAADRGMMMALLHVPLPHQVAADEWSEGRVGFGIEPRRYDLPETEIIEAFCEAQNLPCFMSAPLLRDIAAERSSRVYFRYDYALTQVGHRALVNFLREPLHDMIIRVAANDNPH